VEGLAILVAVIGGPLLGLGCARGTPGLHPWVGGCFGCAVLGMAVLAGEFSTIPAESTSAMFIGIGLMKCGIAMSGCHMARLQGSENSPPSAGLHVSSLKRHPPPEVSELK
jgi:hypothetical protein